jgi:hypothetical protein
MTTKGAAVPFQHFLHVSNVHGAAAVVSGVLATGHSGRCFCAFGCNNGAVITEDFGLGCPRKRFYDFRRNTENFEQYIYTDFREISRHFYCEVYRNSAKFSLSHVHFCIGNSVHFRIGNSVHIFIVQSVCTLWSYSFPPRVKKTNKKLVDKIIMSVQQKSRLLLNVSTVLHHKVLSFTGTCPDKKSLC